MIEISEAENHVRLLLYAWAENTRLDRHADILKHHHPNVVVYDVLKPEAYYSASQYRDSWDEWQPQTQGENTFQFESLEVTANDNLAFANGIIECGGTTLDGHTFSDRVRATFCIKKFEREWKVVHQHISKAL